MRTWWNYLIVRPCDFFFMCIYHSFLIPTSLYTIATNLKNFSRILDTFITRGGNGGVSGIVGGDGGGGEQTNMLSMLLGNLFNQRLVHPTAPVLLTKSGPQQTSPSSSSSLAELLCSSSNQDFFGELDAHINTENSSEETDESENEEELEDESSLASQDELEFKNNLKEFLDNVRVL